MQVCVIVIYSNSIHSPVRFVLLDMYQAFYWTCPNSHYPMINDDLRSLGQFFYACSWLKLAVHDLNIGRLATANRSIFKLYMVSSPQIWMILSTLLWKKSAGNISVWIVGNSTGCCGWLVAESQLWAELMLICLQLWLTMWLTMPHQTAKRESIHLWPA